MLLILMLVYTISYVSSSFFTEAAGISSFDPQSIVGILPQPYTSGTRYAVYMILIVFLHGEIFFFCSLRSINFQSIILISIKMRLYIIKETVESKMECAMKGRETAKM